MPSAIVDAMSAANHFPVYMDDRLIGLGRPKYPVLFRNSADIASLLKKIAESTTIKDAEMSHQRRRMQGDRGEDLEVVYH